MRLYHETDIAIEPIDDRNQLEKAMQINDEFYIPSSSKGIIKLSRDPRYVVGSKVYFDPRMMISIDELKLVIVDQKAILIGEID